MLRRILKRLPFSYRVLLSGYMPEYFYGIGYLDQRYPLEELRALGYVSERGRLPDASPTAAHTLPALSPPACRLLRRLVFLGFLALLVGGLLGRGRIGRLFLGFR